MYHKEIVLSGQQSFSIWLSLKGVSITRTDLGVYALHLCCILHCGIYTVKVKTLTTWSLLLNLWLECTIQKPTIAQYKIRIKILSAAVVTSKIRQHMGFLDTFRVYFKTDQSKLGHNQLQWVRSSLDTTRLTSRFKCQHPTMETDERKKWVHLLIKNKPLCFQNIYVMIFL